MKKKQKRLEKAIVISLLLGSCLVPTALAGAAEKEVPVYDLDTVVVTAGKMEQKVKDVAGSVTVITAQDISKLNVKTLDEAMKMSAGVFSNRSKGMMNTTTAVTMRGFNGQQRTLVLLDGQPINQAYAGSVSWSSIPIQSVERIEIVKGSNSALYGGNAMGGVINIITKNPEKPEARISVKAESNNTWVMQVDGSDKLNDKLSYQFGFERKISGGYITDQKTVEAKNGSSGVNNVLGWTSVVNSTGQTRYLVGDSGNNSWDESSYRLKLMYKLDDQRSLSVGWLHNKYVYNYPGNGDNYLTRNGNAFIGNASVGSGKYITTSNGRFFGLPGGKESDVYTFGYKDKQNGWTFNCGLNSVNNSWYVSSASSPSGGTGRISETSSKRYNWDIQKEIQLNPKDRAVFGINLREDWINNQETGLSNWKDYSTRTSVYSHATGRARTWALFAQNEHKINDHLTLTYGGRYDSWSNFDGMSMDSTVNSGKAINYDERSDSAFSPKISLLYKVDDKSSWHASWGKAFNPPDLYNMYRSWVSTSNPPNGSTSILYDGNPDLKAETVESIELGWNKQLSDKTNVSINYFHNDIENMGVRLDMGINKPGTTWRWYKYDNAASGRTDGVELELSHKFNAAWSSFLNYTCQNPIISSYPQKTSIEGKIVQSVPKQILNFGFDYKKDKLRGNLTASYVSKQYSNDDNSDTVNNVYGSYDPYFVVNTNFEYQFDQSDSVMIGINNLFDRQYYSYYITPGRSYSMQWTHKF